MTGILTACSTLDRLLCGAHLTESSAYPGVRRGAMAQSVLLAALVIIIISVISVASPRYSRLHPHVGTSSLPGHLARGTGAFAGPLCLAVWGAWPLRVLGVASAGGFGGAQALGPGSSARPMSRWQEPDGVGGLLPHVHAHTHPLAQVAGSLRS